MKSAGYIKYPVDMFKWFLLLIGGDEPEAWGGGVKDEQGDRDDSVGTSNIAGRRGDRRVIPFIAVSSSLTMEIDMPYPSMSGSEYVIDADIKARYNFVLEYIHIFYFI
jgi:hypothetical protein